MRTISLLSVSLILIVAVPAFSEEICFPVPISQAMLGELEAGRQCIGEALPAADGIIAVQRDRLDAVTAERDKALEDQKNSEKRCEEAVKEARGTWFQRAKSAGGYMGLGGVFVLIIIGLLAL